MMISRRVSAPGPIDNRRARACLSWPVIHARALRTSPAEAPVHTSAASLLVITATRADTAVTKPAAGAPGPSETFVYGVSADPTNIDPHQTVDGNALLAIGRVYDGLVQLRPGAPKPGAPLEVDPDLAESWTVSDDSLRYTF